MHERGVLEMGLPHRHQHLLRASFVRIVILASLALGLTGASTQPVAAECVSFTPWPSFLEVAPTAKRIVVGTVAATPQGGGQPFTLEVEEVLRGSAPGTMHIKGVESGVPPGRSACIGQLIARFGDRIAIAFDGRAKGVKGRVTTAAWIQGEPSPLAMRGAETLTIEEVRAAAGETADPAWAVGDAEAAVTCAALLEDSIPDTTVRSGEPTESAAYRLTGPEWADYVRMVDPGEVSIVEQLEALRAVESFDICAFDGDLMASGPSGEVEPAVRVVVSIGPDGPELSYVAHERTDEVPIRFDLLRK